jgi:hypothetical protein
MLYSTQGDMAGRISWRPAMTPAISVSLPEAAYLRCLRVLAAWWCLGSSVLHPQVLTRYEVQLGATGSALAQRRKTI